MNMDYLPAIANHLWQSTLLAGVAGLLALALGNNRARVRHAVWLAASCKFLIPVSLFIALGSHVRWRTAPEVTSAGLPVVMDRLSQPFAVRAVSSDLVVTPPAANPLPAVLGGIWACGFLGIACSWWVRWRRTRAVVRAGSAVQVAIPIPAIVGPTLLEPGVFGVFRPVLLLPEGIFKRLTTEQLQAVIAHELCHVRHRDNLAAAVHMFVETVFWFHPLVWWMGKRMLEERERACDEEVLRMGNQPRVYADAILNVCKLYVESPMACVSGIAGANLKKRIAAIMNNRVADRLSFAKKAILAVAGAAAIVIPIVVGVVNAPAVEAQSTAAPKFETVSIQACGPGAVAPKLRASESSPEELRLPCQTVVDLVQWAYVNFANGHLNPLASVPISGGPAWAASERYEVNAKAAGPESLGTVNGPMLRAVLEDSFRLKIHRETREVPVYALTVTGGGAKLQPSTEGSCIPFDPDHPPHPEPGMPLPSVCGWSGLRNTGFELPGGTMANLCKSLSDHLDRNVIDKTGIVGTFNIHLNLSTGDLGLPVPGGSASIMPAAPPPAAVPELAARTAKRIEDALQEVGLKLEPAVGPGEFLVIDHVERPSEN